jgi:nitrate/TMAO reductase-like tetraheme cytochrome c subunit
MGDLDSSAREPDGDAGEVEAESPAEPLTTRSLYRHPLAAVGGALVGAGVFAFIILLAIDLTSGRENPYRSLVTFIAVPAVITVGAILFLLAIRIQVVQARRRGEKVRFNLRIEPSDPRYMRNLWLFLGLLAALLLLVGFSSFKAYEATDTVAFCGESCHTVMEPQAVTYQDSAHARVPCAECHIGPGASFWVKAKVDGLRQVWRTVTNSYDRPVATPIEDLRPAQETCEQCHWPDQFYGQKLVNISYYQTDEDNSPWSISLLVNVGGGNPRTGELEGIHWHMIGGNTIEYAATDRERQEIAYVRRTDQFGNVSEYFAPESPVSSVEELEDADLDLRRFDCIDCHNRPSHHFLPPATAMNLQMSKGNISAALPFVRKVGLELLNAPYETREEANEAIATGLDDYYRVEYPDQHDELAAEIQRASESLLSIYNENFFPEMRTDYRVRTNNLSHFVNDGCFRCHFSELETAQGVRISSGCESCHAVVAQGPSVDLSALETDLNGLDFRHPVDVGGVWERVPCTGCHTPAQGY